MTTSHKPRRAPLVDDVVGIADVNRPTVSGKFVRAVARYLDRHPDAYGFHPPEVLLVRAVVASHGDDPDTWPRGFARALTERVGERALREGGLSPLQVRALAST